MDSKEQGARSSKTVKTGSKAKGTSSKKPATAEKPRDKVSPGNKATMENSPKRTTKRVLSPSKPGQHSPPRQLPRIKSPSLQPIREGDDAEAEVEDPRSKNPNYGTDVKSQLRAVGAACREEIALSMSTRKPESSPNILEKKAKCECKGKCATSRCSCKKQLERCGKDCKCGDDCENVSQAQSQRAASPESRSPVKARTSRDESKKGRQLFKDGKHMGSEAHMGWIAWTGPCKRIRRYMGKAAVRGKELLVQENQCRSGWLLPRNGHQGRALAYQL